MEERVRKMKTARAWTLAERWVWFVVGVFINAFGVALITKAALGTSPISGVPYVLSLAFPFSFGMTTFVFNLVLIAFQALLLRRDFNPFQWLQIAVNIAFSVSIDIGMLLLSWFEPAALWEELAALALGCAVLGFGISIEVAPGVLVVPGEGVVRTVSTVTHRRFGSCKIVFDFSLVLVACALSFLFFGQIVGLGVGTIVAALVVGLVVNFCNRHVPLTGHIVNVRIRSDRLRDAIAKASASRSLSRERVCPTKAADAMASAHDLSVQAG